MIGMAPFASSEIEVAVEVEIGPGGAPPVGFGSERGGERRGGRRRRARRFVQRLRKAACSWPRELRHEEVDAVRRRCSRRRRCPCPRWGRRRPDARRRPRSGTRAGRRSAGCDRAGSGRRRSRRRGRGVRLRSTSVKTAPSPWPTAFLSMPAARATSRKVECPFLSVPSFTYRRSRTAMWLDGNPAEPGSTTKFGSV